MSKKTHASFLALVLILAVAGLISSKIEQPAEAASTQASTALAKLPASDFILLVDAQRLMTDTLPSFLATNPALLARVNARIERSKEVAGIDLRTLDSIAIGARFTGASANEFNFVAIAEGRFDANALIEAGFAAAKLRGVQREEQQYEGKTIFVIIPPQKKRPEQDSNKTASTASNDKSEPVAEKRVEIGPATPCPDETPTFKASVTSPDRANASVKKKRAEEIAVVALDANTLAFGNPESVRAAIDTNAGRGHVDDELVALATITPQALIGFSGKIPPAVVEKFGGQSTDPKIKLAASVRQFYGSVSAVGTDLETFLTLRTENATQAHEIKEALDALKLISSFAVRRPSTGNHAKIRSLSDLVKELSIVDQGNEVQIRAKLTQAHLTPFMRSFN
ncbi:MAG TPA: hypothetical protein VD966_13095 [Pyrinomonadaceae bacterium]|nr:hypothetical protein [Pyrinomonadaceae bacterium]